MRRRGLVVLGLAVCAVWAGCSGDRGPVGAREARCRSACEQSKRCPSQAGAREVDCFTSCDDVDAINRANDCHDEFDAYYDCVERAGVCADLSTDCEEQQGPYSDCISDPCSTDPDRDTC